MKRRRTPKSSEQSAAAEHPKSFRMLKVTRILSQVRHPEFGGGAGPQFGVGFAVCVCNDPSAGSPTETLLRLLLPVIDRKSVSSSH
ncbi:hypothetical protein CIT14_21570, partial [Virgibacillus profundi]